MLEILRNIHIIVKGFLLAVICNEKGPFMANNHRIITLFLQRIGFRGCPFESKLQIYNFI